MNFRNIVRSFALFSLIFGFGTGLSNIAWGQQATLAISASQDFEREAWVAVQNSTMEVCSAMTLFLIAPGLAMFYGGMVRKKNVLNIMIQCLGVMALTSLLWFLFGYSLAFSNGGRIDEVLGGSDFMFGRGVQRRWDPSTGTAITPMLRAAGRDTSITRMSHLFFECMLCVLAPCLLCGAFAERMKFSATIVFASLWSLIVYCPLAHWVWGGGFLTHGDDGWFGGVLDFGGSTVVHLSSGISALVASILVGPRLGKGREPMPPHNVTYTAIGAAMLWFGWIGMHVGCALGSSKLSTSVALATHLAASSGAISWASVEWFKRGKPSLLGLSSGMLAGLVCISAGAGFVQPMSAILMGAVAGLTCYFACAVLKQKLRYDDTLDVFGVHAVGGSLGCLLTGLLATRATWDIGRGKPLGLLEGGSVMPAQLLGIFLVAAYSAICSILLLKIVDWTMGLRASATEERQGLDITQHGEEGYIFL